MEFKYKPEVKHVEMPCWTGKGCLVEAARLICVFYFGQASVMWEARCKSSQHLCALCSWSIPSPIKTAVYWGGACGLVLGFFSWPFIPWWNTILQQEWSQPSKGSSWHHPGTLEPSLGLCCDTQGLPNMARQAVYCLGEEQKPKWSILNPSKIMVELL